MRKSFDDLLIEYAELKANWYNLRDAYSWNALCHWNRSKAAERLAMFQARRQINMICEA